MQQKTIAFLTLVIFSFFLFNASYAYKIYLRPPIMRIQLNTSDSVEHSLFVSNLNNVSMGINATVVGDISDIITITNPSFEIQSNENKTIDFVTNTKEPGVYTGQIIVTYLINETPLPYQLSSDITIIATKNPNPNIEIPIIPSLVIIVILVIIISIVWFKRGRT